MFPERERERDNEREKEKVEARLGRGENGARLYILYTIPREIIRPVKSVSARGPRRPLSSRDEYEIDKSVSGGSKGRFHRLTGSRQTKLTMNGQLTWRLCQLTAMADVTREPN